MVVHLYGCNVSGDVVRGLNFYIFYPFNSYTLRLKSKRSEIKYIYISCLHLQHFTNIKNFILFSPCPQVFFSSLSVSLGSCVHVKIISLRRSIYELYLLYAIFSFSHVILFFFFLFLFNHLIFHQRIYHTFYY